MTEEADLVFLEGSVITVDPRDRTCEAAAVTGNRIVYTGDSKTARRWIGKRTRVVDLKGRSLLPGFIDAHCHAAAYGAMKLRVVCKSPPIGSIEDLKREVGKHAMETPPDQWILGQGYDQTKLSEKRHPTRKDLDEAAPDHKVFLTRVCGHLSVANSLALKALGIGPDTPDPAGGRIERDATGEPTGLLYEQAQMAVRVETRPSYDELKKGLVLMEKDFLRYGITSLHDASGWNCDEIRLFQEGATDGWLRIRVYFMVRAGTPQAHLGEDYLSSGLVTGFGNDRLRLGPYKLMMDGSVGGRSAAMRKAYIGDPSNFGILYLNQDNLDDHVRRAHRAGFQVAIHAIGDRAIDMVLESYGKALQSHPRTHSRHRIEHCGWLDEGLIGRIKATGCVPVLGVSFIYEHGDSFFGAVGDEGVKRIYRLGSLMRGGIIAALSSDAPVIDPNPMRGLHCAVTRKTQAGRPVSPEEAVTIPEAIRAYTLHGAYASFEEHLKGSIEVGKLADLIVLSGDMTKAAPEDLPDLSVIMTVIDGKAAYEDIEALG